MATTNDPDTASQAHQEPLQGLQDDARHLKERGKEHFEHYRDHTAEQIDTLAENAQAAARQMADNDTLGLSGYVSDLAQSMTGLAENLRGKNADELLQEAGKLARDNPLLFITGSVALGLGLSRVLKVSMSTADSSPSPAPYDPIGSSGPVTDDSTPPPPDVLHSAHDVPGDTALQRDLPGGNLS
ncbi:hypothetical protein [Pseudomonas sp. NPDC089734]|uniref:hypothetical protein n=1 Tax=Pseudomonas sp. NPDC089734 TaxID=3364469 RepID=UPI003828BACB